MFQFLKTSVNAIHRPAQQGHLIADVNISVSLDTCNDLQDSEAEFSLTIGEAEELVARLNHTIAVAKRAVMSFREQVPEGEHEPESEPKEE